MEEVRASETSANLYQTALRNIPEDGHLQPVIVPYTEPYEYSPRPHVQFLQDILPSVLRSPKWSLSSRCRLSTYFKSVIQNIPRQTNLWSTAEQLLLNKPRSMHFGGGGGECTGFWSENVKRWPLWRLRRRWEDIKINLKEIGLYTGFMWPRIAYCGVSCERSNTCFGP
jgi:hypothetical protein